MVTGSTGQVGGSLVRKLAAMGVETLAPTRNEMDLASPDSIRSYVAAKRPRWIVNPAAYTAVDKAETDREAAEAINAKAPGVLGEAAAAVGSPVLHFSTDYVFAGDGTEPWLEEHPTGPLGVYGATKLAGEQALATSGAAYAIFRTSWVYAATGKNFFITILKYARERETMKIVSDQAGAPTWADDLADLAIFTMEKAEATGDRRQAIRELSGVFHACDCGETTWFGFAEEIVRLARRHEPETRFAQLYAIPSSEYPTPAVRPLNSRMSCAKLERELGFIMPSWQNSLERVIEEYYASRG